MTKSTFTNATGLHDPGLKVTARELGKLAQHIIGTYPDFYKIYGEREFTYNKIRQYNRNPLLAMGRRWPEDRLHQGSRLRPCGSADQNGMRLIVVVMGAKARKSARTKPEAARVGLSQFRSPHPVCRRADRRRSQSLRRRKRLRAARRLRHDPADGAAQCQRKDRRARRLIPVRCPRRWSRDGRPAC